jgi:hypothetical protein
MAPQPLLGRVGPHDREIVEALAAGDQRLAEGEDRLRRRVAAPALLNRDRIEQLPHPEALDELADEHEAGVRRDLLAGGRDLDQRRPPSYFHLQECLPVARGTSSSTPMLSGREDVLLGANFRLTAGSR